MKITEDEKVASLFDDIRSLVTQELGGFGCWAFGRYWSGTLAKNGTISIVSKGSEGGSTSRS